MALSIARSYRSDSKDSRRRVHRADHADQPWRLPSNHVQDLRDVARGVEESNAGLACRYLVDQMASPSSTEVDDDGYVHHLEAAERFCDRFGVWKHPAVASWRMRVLRARRALDKLTAIGGAHATHVAVLHVAHGYPDPLIAQFPELSSLGELAGLVRYTDHVEAHREQLVKFEARERLGDPPNVAEYRERLAFADRAITSADALRHGLLSFGEPMPVVCATEPRHVHEGHVMARTIRRKAHDARRGAFVLACKLEATRMLGSAELEYHQAWLCSAV
jgi:hypothetical protein